VNECPVKDGITILNKHRKDSMTQACPVCESKRTERFASICVPTECSVLCASPDQALSIRRAEIALAFCPSCGMIFNAAFERSLVKYDLAYDNSLYHSPAFRSYCSSLIRRLIDTYELQRKTVIEVGCGDGNFLLELCTAGDNRGIGYDPACRVTDAFGRVRFVAAMYSPTAAVSADLICCRHVIEHIPAPCGFLECLRSELRPGSLLYIEVPDAMSVLGGDSLWDIIYSHCCYFAECSLGAALERVHFKVLQVQRSFAGQFLTMDARAVDAAQGLRDYGEVPDEIRIVAESVKRFPHRLQDAVRRSATFIEGAAKDGARLALWGAGAKSVTFVNLVPGADRIPIVIDLNPRKQGMFIPGTAQPIIPPSRLADHPPDIVILLNPAYSEEVSKFLDTMRVQVRQLCVASQGVDAGSSPVRNL